MREVSALQDLSPRLRQVETADLLPVQFSASDIYSSPLARAEIPRQLPASRRSPAPAGGEAAPPAFSEGKIDAFVRGLSEFLRDFNKVRGFCKGAGVTAGALSGWSLGGKLGAFLGSAAASLLPGIGTALGGVVGYCCGLVLAKTGARLGRFLGETLYKVISGNSIKEAGSQLNSQTAMS